jgi:hypothetical protein
MGGRREDGVEKSTRASRGENLCQIISTQSSLFPAVPNLIILSGWTDPLRDCYVNNIRNYWVFVHYLV